jgi:hypothetical protein
VFLRWWFLKIVVYAENVLNPITKNVAVLQLVDLKSPVATVCGGLG